ncbi:rhomboid family intramembrane serine protease [Flavobacterium agricola]|uniref:Rhomboid family intramembrane serine protease n=1 Tax=Flavobacterium agricola TaxID=2870839 RepID=A0ABY6LVI2_9FLAO|nr:rhomboid family intramembrane serine protease [Flavobacterium agricola]UYW00335.1 rhomboid family intramembrane serine protease [Flavobacterium agricola]
MRFIQDLKTYYNHEQSYQKIIIWNVALAVVFLIFNAYYKPGYQFLIDWFSLSSHGWQSLYKPWTYVTYAFLHADFFHLLSNVIMLFFAARLFYTLFTDKQFVTVYFLGVIFSGLVYSLVSVLFGKPTVLVGASAGILAVLFTVLTYNPHAEVKLLLIGRIKLWMIGAFLILFFVIQIPSSNFGGHVAHFAGAFFGFLYAKLLAQGIDLSKKMELFFNFFIKQNKRKKHTKNTPFKKVYYNNKTTESTAKKVELDKQKRINEILDKISSSGYDSLTAEEKDYLFKAGE